MKENLFTREIIFYVFFFTFYWEKTKDPFR
jgi:hypothetical protein